MERWAVICVYWRGDFRARPYSDEWVRRLKAMVQRNLPAPHSFFCLSNVDRIEGAATIPLEKGWPGWWSKMELFSPRNLRLADRFLYIDLDALIVGDLEPFFQVPSTFSLLPYIEGARAKSIKPDGRGFIRCYNSSVMVYNQDDIRLHKIYRAFKKGDGRWMKRFRGDQDFIASVVQDANTLPRSWVSKLKNCKDGDLGEDTKIVLSMPWKCEQAAEMFDWVREIWTL
jgi:hypothetical protein